MNETINTAVSNPGRLGSRLLSGDDVYNPKDAPWKKSGHAYYGTTY